MTELDDRMSEAIRRQAERRAASRALDRQGWTPRQWCEDAKRLMLEPDGAITSLVNGHALHLIQERDRLLELLAKIRLLALEANEQYEDGCRRRVNEIRNLASKELR